jgi:lysophospholipase L1-like esterase
MKNNLEEITRRAQNIGATVLLVSMKIPPNYGNRYADLFYNGYPQLTQQLNITLVPFLLEDVALHKDSRIFSAVSSLTLCLRQNEAVRMGCIMNQCY